jgi:hypothetical protein
MMLCRSCSNIGTAAFNDQFDVLLLQGVRSSVKGGCIIGSVQVVGAPPISESVRRRCVPAGAFRDATLRRMKAEAWGLAGYVCAIANNSRTSRIWALP